MRLRGVAFPFALSMEKQTGMDVQNDGSRNTEGTVQRMIEFVIGRDDPSRSAGEVHLRILGRSICQSAWVPRP